MNENRTVVALIAAAVLLFIIGIVFFFLKHTIFSVFALLIGMICLCLGIILQVNEKEAK